MDNLFSNYNSNDKMRIIQEHVPGKQLNLTHIIASPEPVIYQKLGLDPKLDYSRAAIGIISTTPYECSIIAGDIATKSGNITIGFIDRFSGTVIFTGLISDVESAIKAVREYMETTLGFAVCPLTKT